MIDSLLIANRGEIACRIIRTAKSLGIRTVAVYSEADTKARHIRLADEAYCIGPAPSNQSYLNQEAILSLAKETKVNAIHPGYGFFSENAAFAKACLAAGFIFVGPKPETIALMGIKDLAKAHMAALGIPVIPAASLEYPLQENHKIALRSLGFPMLLKAVAGGGGKGMRIVHKEENLLSALAEVQAEADRYFKDPRIMAERYFPHARHIEVQIMGDCFGNIVHLFDRDCSLQRRHQKILEEAPGLADSPLRTRLLNAALRAGKSLGYLNAGTLEFLVSDQEFYFMEMNTRLQVEHPVTEMLCGLDLVEWQLKIAQGLPLPKNQTQIQEKGHAIEVRLCAEDPYKDFLPTGGTLKRLITPPNMHTVRLDNGIALGDTISSHYDPLLAKLIVQAPTREKAIVRLKQALNQTHYNGISNNLSFLRSLLCAPAFLEHQFDTQWLEQSFLSTLIRPELSAEDQAISAYLFLRYRLAKEEQSLLSPAWRSDGWQNFKTSTQVLNLNINEQIFNLKFILEKNSTISFKIKDKNYNVTGFATQDNRFMVEVNQSSMEVLVFIQAGILEVIHKEMQFTIAEVLYQHKANANTEKNNLNSLTAPMSGLIVQVFVKPKDLVTTGQVLMRMEAMKLIHTIKAPADGEILNLPYTVGAQVTEGAELINFAPKISIKEGNS